TDRLWGRIECGRGAARPMTLRTKILPAPVAPAALPRAQLQARLDQGLSRRLTTVIAGAGVGESTLLAAWAQRHEVAWYTLGAQDAALSTLGRGLVDALRLRVPDLPVDLAPTPSPRRCPRPCRSACAARWRSCSTTSTRWRPTAPRCMRSRRCAARRPR